MRFIANLWRFVRRPSSRYALGTLIIVGFVGGVLFWGAFNWALELSNKQAFCISCHEMRATVFEELKKTVHYHNPSGVRATCADCHVPKDWAYKVVRKIQATFNELPKHVLGVYDNLENFEAERLALAQRVWASMEATDSRECRNCHHMDAMDLASQQPRARGQHESAILEGETCIDCHKGIAHKPVHKELESGEKEGEGGGFTLE